VSVPAEVSRVRGRSACAAGTLLTAAREQNATPTRSARTPLVMRPLRHRLETPASRACSLEQRRRRSHHVCPVPLEVGARGPRTRRSRGRIGAEGRLVPLFREEDRDRPHPRCLSSVSRRPRMAFGATEAARTGDPRRPCGTSPRWNRGHGCPQSVANLWTMSHALTVLAGAAALDGAAGARLGGASGGGQAPPSCRGRVRTSRHQPRSSAYRATSPISAIRTIRGDQTGTSPPGTGNTVLSTVCCQPGDNVRRLFGSRWIRCP